MVNGTAETSEIETQFDMEGHTEHTFKGQAGEGRMSSRQKGMEESGKTRHRSHNFH